MTCFWDGILSSLNDKDFLKHKSRFPKSVSELINFIKNHNTIPENIKWNNNQLSLHELQEHYNAIEEINISDINNGYLCSTCDSVLLLISYLFKIDIVHTYVNNNMIYKGENNMHTIFYNSSSSHFTYRCRK